MDNTDADYNVLCRLKQKRAFRKVQLISDRIFMLKGHIYWQQLHARLIETQWGTRNAELGRISPSVSPGE